jgi:hypothetical protein
MRAKIFTGLFCCLIVAGSRIQCRHSHVEDHQDASQMAKQTIEQVQEKYQDRWMAMPGVVGVGIGAFDGKPVIKVLVVKKTPELEKKIPKMVEGYLVLIEETGEIRALEKN